MKSSKTLCWSMACINIALTAGVHADTISIRADTWFPMNGHPGDAKPGYMIEFAEAIFGAHGHKIDYQTMPWERSVREVRKGTFDCVVGAYKEDTPDFVFPTHHWGEDHNAFYVLKGNPWRFTDIASIKSKALGVISGYSYGSALDEFIKDPANSQWIQALNGETALDQNIKKLISGRVDVLLESRFVMGSKLITSKDAKQVEFAGEMANSVFMYIACSPKKAQSKQWVKLVDDGMPELHSSGKFEAILAKYGISPWQQLQTDKGT